MRTFFWVAILIVVFIIGGLVGSWATSRSGRVNGTVPFFVATSGGTAIGSEVSFTNGFVPVVRKVLPGVVNIASSKVVKSTGSSSSPFFSDPFFRQFFGNPRQFFGPQERREHSLGSGVIVSPDGYILTNNHVVGGANEIKIFLPDKREFSGEIVGTDPKTDVAVVKISQTNLPVLTFGDSAHVQVGDFAVAVGNPFGVGETVTMGIVSATGRGGLNIETYEDFIQTDAAINPGNSGGALVNVRGELVGINTAILSGGGGGNQGIGFAIPANVARQVMDQILKQGKVIRGWMGVSIQPVTTQIANAFGMKGEARGALIASVEPGSPADRAGLKQGDIILQLNGNPVTDSRELSLKISMMSPGAKVSLKVLRNGNEMEIPATLGEMPSGEQAAKPQGGGPEAGPRLGVNVQPLTPDIARQLGLPPQTRGVVIADVQPGSPADDGGLQRGDVIQEVNRKAISSVNEFQRLVQQAGNQPVLLLINRNGNHIYLTVEPR